MLCLCFFRDEVDGLRFLTKTLNLKNKHLVTGTVTHSEDQPDPVVPNNTINVLLNGFDELFHLNYEKATSRLLPLTPCKVTFILAHSQRLKIFTVIRCGNFHCLLRSAQYIDQFSWILLGNTMSYIKEISGNFNISIFLYIIYDKHIQYK